MRLPSLLRSLVRSPVLALTVVATLALGVGVLTTAFAIVNAAIIRQPPFDEARRVVMLYDPVTGKRLTRYQSFRGTKREAEKKLIELLGQAETGSLLKRSAETLGDYISRWTAIQADSTGELKAVADRLEMNAMLEPITPPPIMTMSFGVIGVIRG